MDKTGARAVAPYLEKHTASYTTLLDPDMIVAGIFTVRGTPTSFMLNRNGEVIGGAVGYRDWTSEEAQALIESLL
jgi:thioredoxin-related protein